MSEVWVMVLWSALGIALIVGVVYLIYRKDHPPVRKTKGRESTTQSAVQALRSFARSNSFRFIAPARLVRGENTAKLDAVMVGYFGVLGLKALGYNGEIYGEAGDENWLQVGEDGQRNYFANPITEAAADVRVVRDALFTKKLKKVPVEVVCVFTNPKAQIALPRSTGHLNLKEFKALLRKDKYLEDTGLDLDAVEGALKDSLDKA